MSIRHETLLLASALVLTPAFAAYPEKAIRIVVPSPAVSI